MKKKLATAVLGMGLVIGLVGCDFADGIDHDFGLKAESIFLEIDDDTMEMERSDGDDVANFDLLTVEAETKREVAFVEALEGMLKLQSKVVEGDRDSLKEYLKARNAAIKALGLTKSGYHMAPEFQFTEE
jgi:hypothetical protein